MDSRPFRIIDAARASPVQHRHEIGVGDGEAVEEIVPALEMVIEMIEAPRRLLARIGVGAFREAVTGQAPSL
jgi:hypothetical protein